MVEDKNEKIIKRLNVMIMLLLDFVDLLSTKYEAKVPEKFKMARLKQLGLGNEEIGLLFKKTKREVAKQIYETKRKKKAKK